jgi:hypothetical protein
MWTSTGLEKVLESIKTSAQNSVGNFESCLSHDMKNSQGDHITGTG